MPIKETGWVNKNIYITSVPREKVTSALHVGQVIRGTIMEQLTEDLYIINFKGFHLNSQSKKKFKRKQSIYVKIKEIGEQIIMQLLPEEEHRNARRQANRDELKSHLEEIGIEPDETNRFVADAMLRHGLPLSKANFHEIFQTADLLNVKAECEVEAIVYLTSKGYARTARSIDLALYLDLPDDSILLGELINMSEREIERSETEDGYHIRLFDGREETGFCFRFKNRMLGNTALLGILKGEDARIEVVASDEDSRTMLEQNCNILAKKLVNSSLPPASIRFVSGNTAEKADEFDDNQSVIGVDLRV